MKFADRIERIKLDKISIRRDERQRREISTTGLLESIRDRGVYNPIIVRHLPEGDQAQVELVAGERRLTASIQLGLDSIPCRFVEDLSPLEAKIIELEENIKRQDLAWQDELFAIKELHELYTSLDPTWTQVQTADSLGFTAGMISRIMRVAKNFTDPRIAAAPTMIAAYNMLARLDSRKAGDAMSEIMEAGISIFTGEPVPIPASTSSAVPTQTSQPAPEPKPKTNGVEDSILNEDFLEWAPNYTGPRFNFIHCDFPYGINVFAGKLSGRQKWHTYGDEPDDYFALIQCLCDNLDRLMSHSGHLMFWFSMENYEETLRAFRELAPGLTFQKFPLFWMKSDNVGIIPDAKRQPRRIYETALIASREDRFILRSVSNAYAAPTDKAHHHSTKPEPVLRHFFQMFVDETSKVLDPTCGSGSALRAAESLGAQKTLGLEVDPEHCENARSALRHFRALRAMSKGAATNV